MSDTDRLAVIERRLQALEDAEAIRNLKSHYAALCDDNYNADGIAALFAENAVWESPGLGRYEGREAIRTFFRGAAKIFSFAIHYSLNGQIHVNGDTAHAQWYLFMPCTVKEITKPAGAPASNRKPTPASTAPGSTPPKSPAA